MQISLEENKIIIQQAYYGEVNRAHSCITQTTNDSELTSFLIAFSDRPAALPPGVELTPYLSGVAFSKQYIFTKTFPDPFATRAGMVFTHALILNISNIHSVNNLDDILSYFVNEVPKERTELKPINLNIPKENSISANRVQPKFIQETIAAFISGTYPILFSGSIESFKIALQQIWNSPNTEFRKKIKFRTSFTPSDLEGIKDLTIVSIQKEFLPKWTGHKIVQSENNEQVEITSHSEALFLGHKKDNPFYSFLIELNVIQSDFQIFGQCDKVYNDITALDKIEDANILRQDIRLLSKISPSPSDGGKVKERFIKRLEELIHNGKDSNIKALRNIEWSAFENGEAKGKGIVFDFIANELLKATKIPLLSELLNIACSEEPKIWWHNSIQEYFKIPLANYTKPLLENLWKLIDDSEQTCKNVFSLVNVSTESEHSLRNSIPVKIKDETSKALEAISKKRKWFLFHADLLLKYLLPDKAIVKQLVIEDSLSLKDSVGVKYLSEKLNDKELIALTLSTIETKLIQLTVERISKDKSLLKEIDVSIPCWLTIWSITLNKTRNISAGIEGKEQAIINSVFDLLVKENPIQEIIIELIASSTFADVTNYKQRDKLWKVIPTKFTEIFLDVTSKKIVQQLLSGKVDVTIIEKQLSTKITSDAFMSNFLEEHKNDISSVIKVYELFSNLKDDFLSDYISYYRNAITETDSKNLGTLVNKYKFNKSAKSIYEKSKYNHTFRAAFEICQDLVTISFWDSFFSSSDKQKKYKHETINMPQSKQNDLPTVVILTAIQEEYLAVKEHLTNVVDGDRNNTDYEIGIFEYNGKGIANVIIRECGAKNTTASQETERAINYFNPNMMMFVGIAGSRKPNDFKIGDVIFPDKIYYYEGGKAALNSFKARPDAISPTFELLEKAKKERKKKDWMAMIKGKYSDSVKANIGIIASGEQLIDHHDSEIGKILNEHYNDSSAVEMEGYGFAKAASRQGSETKNIIVGVVRGISDIIELSADKQAEVSKDRRPDNAKLFASDTAAAFAFWLILKTYE